MKKLISVLLTGIMVLGLSACNLVIDPTESTSKFNSDKVKSEYKDDKLDMEFAVMMSKIFRGIDDDKINVSYMESGAQENIKDYGIKNYVYMETYEANTNQTGDEILYELKTEIYIFEYDMTSDAYSKLAVGDTLSYYTGYDTAAVDVTAINGQYVLCICVTENKLDINKTTKVTQPIFTLSEDAQKCYDAFIELG